MNIVAVSLEAVHTLCSLEDETSIFSYALLNIYARDG